MTDTLFRCEKTCRFDELANIAVHECDEPFIPLSQSDIGYTLYDRSLPLSTGQDLYLRQGVIKRLEVAQSLLPEGVRLDVTYAYRSAQIQEDKFRKVLSNIVDESMRRYESRYIAPEALRTKWIQATHMKIAAPEVAGHPSGGAVDVRLRDRFNRVMDMGTEMHDITSGLTPYSPAHYYDFTTLFQKNRDMLRRTMCAAGFAPFNGEWWHFSYGDREWAALTGAAAAFYGQKHFDPQSGELRSYNPISAQDILDEVLDSKPAQTLRP